MPALYRRSQRVGRLSPKWSDLRLRVLSATVLGPAALWCVWRGGAIWTALIAVAAFGLAFEWINLFGMRRPAICASAIGLGLLIAGVLAIQGQLWMALIALSADFVVVALYSGRPVPAAGVLYIGLAGVSLLWLRLAGDSGRTNLFFLVLVVWATDIGAYAAGRLFGGPRLAPAVSPGKTWSGAVGGLLAAIFVAELLTYELGDAASVYVGVVAGCFAIASQAGDLFESAVKRRCGVKDSGRLIPGHGGLLDRLDGLLATAPVAAALALISGRDVPLWH